MIPPFGNMSNIPQPKTPDEVARDMKEAIKQAIEDLHHYTPVPVDHIVPPWLFEMLTQVEDTPDDDNTPHEGHWVILTEEIELTIEDLHRWAGEDTPDDDAC